MTTATENKIDLVLQRLDDGEELINCLLKKDDKFCIMGLFLDVYGFDWTKEFEQDNNHNVAYLELDKVVANFNFKYSGGAGFFNYYELPEELQQRILTMMPPYDDKIAKNSQLSLMEINDILNYRKDHDIASINGLLSDIIRSGVLFETQET